MKGDPILRGWKEYKEGRQRYRIRAFGGLHKLKGNKCPYFSLTGETQRWEKRDFSQDWYEDSGGCIHEELLKHWPELKPLTLLHLSDDDGVPSHGAANAWWWMRGWLTAFDPCFGPVPGRSITDVMPTTGSFPETPQQCGEIFADHVRLTVEQADAVRVALMVDCYAKSTQYQRIYEGALVPLGRKFMDEWCEAQKPRWKAEADAAIKEFGLVVYGDV